MRGDTYYFDHQEEIDGFMREEDDLVEAMRREIPSKVASKLNG